MDSKSFLDSVYKKGKLFKFPKYIETSLEKNIASHYANGRGFLIKYNVPKDISGIYMEQLGKAEQAWGNEEEIMLARDLIGKFKSRRIIDGCETIEVDILKKQPIFKKIHEFWKEVEKSKYIDLVDFE